MLSGLLEKFWELLPPIARDAQLEIFDLHYHPGNHTLQIFIMDPSTQTAKLEDCMRADRAFDPVMQMPFVPEGIQVEISSPGISRPMRLPAHFAWAHHQTVEVVLKNQVGEDLKKGQKIQGILQDYSLGHAAPYIDLLTKKSSFRIPIKDLKKIHHLTKTNPTVEGIKEISP